MLPPRSGSGRPKLYQQYIALGVYGNPVGLLWYAEAKVMEWGALMAQQRFVWLDGEGDRPFCLIA